jgi:putative membrane protein
LLGLEAILAMEINMRIKSNIILGAALIVAAYVCPALAKTDKDFLTDAIQGNLAEISVGELAQKNGNSDRVRSFGQMLVQDHSAANEKATKLAKEHDLTPPTQPKPEEKELSDKLAKLSGDEFDKDFANAMVEDHKKAIKEFEEQAQGSGDVASFAKETIPTLKKHLETAESLAGGK